MEPRSGTIRNPQPSGTRPTAGGSTKDLTGGPSQSAIRNPQSAIHAARLYSILDLGYVARERAPEVAAALLEGGAGMLQLRAKNYDEHSITGLAAALLPLCRAAGVPLIVNDHPRAALESGADGVHVGQDDGSLAQVRSITGPRLIVGRSTHSPAQARAALAEGFDYIGYGPLFATPTKPGRPAIGLDGIAAVEAEVGARIPVFCIGGIKPDNLPQVLAAGARRIVVVSALLQSPDIAAATREVDASIADCGLRIAD